MSRDRRQNDSTAKGLFRNANRRLEDVLSGSDGARSLRILLVDDAPVNLAASCRSLDRMGCLVDPVTSGEYAVTMFQDGCGDSRYDLVMIDLNMPGVDGLDTARRIRAIEEKLPPSHPYRRRPVPILALTTRNPGDRMNDCRKAGMNDFMYKPFQSEVLKEALARWVPVPA